MAKKTSLFEKSAGKNENKVLVSNICLKHVLYYSDDYMNK